MRLLASLVMFVSLSFIAINILAYSETSLWGFLGWLSMFFTALYILRNPTYIDW